MSKSGKTEEEQLAFDISEAEPKVPSQLSQISDESLSEQSLSVESGQGEGVLEERDPEAHIPGEVGIWVFVLGDMLVFGLFFTVFTYYRGLNTDLYLQSQASLNQNYGALNTLLLLLSSWFVVMAVSDVRNSVNKNSWVNKDGSAQEHPGPQSKSAPTLFMLAFLCGLGFGVVKIIEYSEKISAGLTITTNEFFMYYYIFTGLHFLHVLIGMGVLVFLWLKARGGVSGESDLVLMESGATFWHMVDLLWIVLFPLIYLMQ